MATTLEQQVDVAPAPFPNLSLPQTAMAGLLDLQHRYTSLGLEGVERKNYTSTVSFKKVIDSQTKGLFSGNGGQYAVFAPVTKKQLATIGRSCSRSYKSLRFFHIEPANTLIVKIQPPHAQPISTGRFNTMIYGKVRNMGLADRLCCTGGTTFEGLWSSKEADSTWTPDSRLCSHENWPTLVMESGLPESIKRLEVEAGWWLDISMGEVKVVLLICVSWTDKKITLDKWELATTPNPEVSEDRPHPTITVPTKTGHVEIVDGKATGAPLRLRFKNLFLRDPGKGQGDIVFTAKELEAYAAYVWRFSKPSKSGKS